MLDGPCSAAQDDPAAVPALIEALADPGARDAAASALGQIGLAAVPALIEALADKNLNVRWAAARALGQVGPAAEPAVPALIEALADTDTTVRWAAFGALARIGPSAEPAVPALIEAVATRDIVNRRLGIETLERIGPAAVPALIEALADKNPNARWAAARALGRVGPAAEPAVPVLIEALVDADPDVREAAARALGQIATLLRDSGAIGALGALREAHAALEHHTDPDVKQYAPLIRRALEYLQLNWWTTTRQDVFDWIETHPWSTSIIGAIPIWLAICFMIFWLSPATILKINQVLRPFDFKLPDKLGGMTISLRHLLLVGVLHHRPRVLDDWVSRHVGRARENFERKRTVEERSVHVPVPVHLDEATISELRGGDLRGVFGAGTGRLQIWGDGGSGKTSIACQIAGWAMADAPEQRPALHRMLPVLIERELDFEVGEGKDPFTETVRGDLETLIEARVGDDLLGALLERRRVLVIIDHLSEMTEATRRRVRPDVPDFPAAALIVTSRLEERLGDRPKAVLRPMRVTGDYLFEFMGAYLRARGVREEFPDREFGRAGTRIAELVGEREVTVLLVKLYLDRLIEMPRRGGDLDKEMPESIPSLMLQYLNDINRAIPDEVRCDERAVHRDAEAVAWACLEERFRPGLGSIDRSVVPKLAAVQAASEMERLAYLETRLRLIETVEPELEQVRFLLDPVAEYLAGLHLVREHGQDEAAWRSLLERLDAAEGGLEAIRGFILALRDCCLYRPDDVPDFLADELGWRGGLDPEKVSEARARESVARHAQQLKALDWRDRLVAAKALGMFGPVAVTALPALMTTLQDDEWPVREAAAYAVREIGPAAATAVPALIVALEDDYWEIRILAAQALGKIGPGAMAAVPVLVSAFNGESRIASFAKEALISIGPPAVPALVKALEDERLRKSASEVLAELGHWEREKLA